MCLPVNCLQATLPVQTVVTMSMNLSPGNEKSGLVFFSVSVVPWLIQHNVMLTGANIILLQLWFLKTNIHFRCFGLYENWSLKQALLYTCNINKMTNSLNVET